MRPYDPDRKAHETCRYGCCTHENGSKHPAHRHDQKRRAREEGKQEIREEIAES